MRTMIDNENGRPFIYKIKLRMDENYAVIKVFVDDESWCKENEEVYYGNLTNCEAFIRLNEDGYF